MQGDASGSLDVTLLVAVAALAPARVEYSLDRWQCSIFTGIGPEAESKHVTLRINYGIFPGISGIYPNPAAESKLG